MPEEKKDLLKMAKKVYLEAKTYASEADKATIQARPNISHNSHCRRTAKAE